MHIEVPERAIDDLDAELSLLGALLMRSAAGPGIDWDAEDIAAIVPAEAFYRPQHQKLYQIILETYRADEPIEMLSIEPKIAAVHEGTDWTEELLGISESFADAQNARYYALRIRTAYLRRRVIQLCTDAIGRIGEPESDPSAVADWMATQIEGIESLSVVDKESIAERVLLEETPNPNTQSAIRVPVGVGRLGDVLGGGLEDGTLTVVGARPSRGKTSLGLGLCLYAAASTDGCPCVYVSAEMGQRQLAHRLIGMRTRLQISRIRSGDMGQAEFERARADAVAMVGREIEQGREIRIIDGVTDVRQIRAMIRREVRQRGIGLAVVDYLGRLDIRGDFKRHDLMIGQIAKEFKNLSIESNLAVVLLCQLNRSATNDNNRRPRLADLRDSGLIEAEADTVVLVHVPDGNVDTNGVSETTLIVAKQRQGEIGDACVMYHKATMSYEGKFFGVPDQKFDHPAPGRVDAESGVPF